MSDNECITCGSEFNYYGRIATSICSNNHIVCKQCADELVKKGLKCPYCDSQAQSYPQINPYGRQSSSDQGIAQKVAVAQNYPPQNYGNANPYSNNYQYSPKVVNNQYPPNQGYNQGYNPVPNPVPKNQGYNPVPPIQPNPAYQVPGYNPPNQGFQPNPAYPINPPIPFD